MKEKREAEIIKMKLQEQQLKEQLLLQILS
jgi:hypothetical protein